MENATRITEIKHNTAIENQQKLITSLIARTLLPVSDHPHTPTRKRKHSKAMTPDDDMEMWDSPKTLLFKRRNLSNDDKSTKPSKRPTRFQKQQAANPNRKSGNRPDSGKVKRLLLNAPPPAPSAILFQSLKRHFPKFKVRMRVGMRLIGKTTNQQIAHQPSNKPAKASRHTSRKRTPKIP